MIFARLTQRWHALRYWREHQSLSRLKLVRRLENAPADDLFRQVSGRDYLARGMKVRERMRCVLAHYRFEEETFNSAYRQAAHHGGLVLWQHSVGQEHDGGSFVMRLEHAPRIDPEGELTLSLVVDGAVLHRLSWTWVEGAVVGVDLPVVPFVTRNAGLWRDAGGAFEAFERVFPNNSPSFFCFAALQGAAQALGFDRVVAVRGSAHVAYEAAQDKAFENAYDGFWRILGGAELDARSFLVPLPFYLKPLQDMPSKHRKRAAQRREHWRAIGDAARAVLLRHMATPAVSEPAAAEAPSTAKA